MMSTRRYGETPYAVALRKKTGLKLSVARLETSCSTRTFDSPYGVTGLKGASSVSGVSVPLAP